MAKELPFVPQDGSKSSPGKKVYRKKSRVFYATQRPVILEYGWQKAYGWDPEINRPQTVRIVYNALDISGNQIGKPMIVGGYVSVRNMPIYGGFSFPALRIGVDLAEVKRELNSRITMASEIAKNGGSGDGEAHGEILFLRRSQRILKRRVARIEKMIKNGWTHIVIASAWRKTLSKNKVIIDRLDLNQNFFDAFFPGNAFPIGSSKSLEANSWVNGDYFIYSLFPIDFNNSRMKKMRDTGRIMPAEKWKFRKIEQRHNGWTVKLRITFSKLSVNVWGKDTGETRRLTPKRKVRKPKEAIETIKKDMQESSNKKETQEAQQNTAKLVENLEHGAGTLSQSNKKEQADFRQKLAEEGRLALIETFEEEHKKMMNRLRSIDPNSEDLDRAVDEALSLAMDWGKIVEEEQIEKDSPGEKYMEEVSETAGKKFGERVQNMLEDIRNMKPDDPDLDDKIDDCLGNAESAQLFGGAGDLDFSSAGNQLAKRAKKKLEELEKIPPDIAKINEVAESVFEDHADAQSLGSDEKADIQKVLDVINEKGVEAVRRMLDAEDWNGAEALRLWKAFTISVREEFSEDELKRFKEKNEEAMIAHYRDNPDLDTNDQLKASIEIHVIVFRSILPDELSNDPRIRAYEELLKNPARLIRARQLEIENTNEVPNPEDRI
jgi:hypothetical protein